MSTAKSILDHRGRTLGVVAFALVVGTGCALPVAVFPVPEQGSGLELRFYDQDENPITEDGLLIVNREFHTLLFGPLAPSNHVVSIRNGRTTIPHEWTPTSLWMFGMYIPLPIHPVILPQQTLTIFPLVPGFHSTNPEYMLFEDGKVTLYRSNFATDSWRSSARLRSVMSK